MTIQDWNRDLFIAYVICCIGSFILFAWTPLGNGRRLVRDQYIVFTTPLSQRIVGFIAALFGPAYLLLDHSFNGTNTAILISVFFGIPVFFAVGLGVNEFSADVEAGTYFTRYGMPGFAPKKTGRLDELRGVQMRSARGGGNGYYVHIMRPEDKEKTSFQIGYFPFRNHAVTYAQRASTDLHIPLLS